MSSTAHLKPGRCTQANCRCGGFEPDEELPVTVTPLPLSCSSTECMLTVVRLSPPSVCVAIHMKTTCLHRLASSTSAEGFPKHPVPNLFRLVFLHLPPHSAILTSGSLGDRRARTCDKGRGESGHSGMSLRRTLDQPHCSVRTFFQQAVLHFFLTFFSATRLAATLLLLHPSRLSPRRLYPLIPQPVLFGAPLPHYPVLLLSRLASSKP